MKLLDCFYVLLFVWAFYKIGDRDLIREKDKIDGTVWDGDDIKAIQSSFV